MRRSPISRGLHQPKGPSSPAQLPREPRTLSVISGLVSHSPSRDSSLQTRWLSPTTCQSVTVSSIDAGTSSLALAAADRASCASCILQVGGSMQAPFLSLVTRGRRACLQTVASCSLLAVACVTHMRPVVTHSLTQAALHLPMS